MDTIKRTRKNDTINSTQNTSPHRPNTEKILKKSKPSKNEEDEEEEKANHRSSDEETAEGSSSNTECDQDSDISVMEDTDEEIDTGEIAKEDWIEQMIETHRRMKWRLAMRSASLPDERWTKKAAT